jgi:nitrite reductase (NADH) small subunit
MFVDVGAENEFQEGQAKVVAVEGRQIGVIRWRTEFYALRNICPHQFAPVCGGYTMPMLVGDHDGHVSVDNDRLVVVCPWHGWEFEARTGRAAGANSSHKLKTYPTKIEGGRIYVDVGRPRRRADAH